jgi:hypothetical protein
MRFSKTGLVAALLAICLGGSLRGSIPAAATGEWVTTGNMLHARSGASSVLLLNGAVLVTGGTDASGAAADTELFEPSGGFVPAGSMGGARAHHASVLLSDGRVLVIGGKNSTGASASTEYYDHGEWYAGPALGEARWGHTATLLDDGRVVVAGGENELGPVASVETFDPSTGEFALAGSLTSARKGHAAARLADGRVLIAGGFNADGVLASTELFDPSTGSITPGPSLNIARAGLTATTLMDGKVLFFGGNDGTNDLKSAEIYAPETQSIWQTAANASIPRRDHQAFLLPNNNAVLLVGGVSGEAAAASAELYLPWRGEFTATGAMTAARFKGTGAALSRESYGSPTAGDGLLMLAGGEALDSSEAYRFATIRTDKDDYSPGMNVYVSARGWQPNENVTFGLRELPAEHEARSFTLQADASGNIDNALLFVVEEHHLGIRFNLTARGAASQAQVTFTDARSWSLAISPTGVSTSSTNTFSLTATNTSSNNEKLACLSVTVPTEFTSLGVPALVAPASGWTVTRSGQVLTAKANSNSDAINPSETVVVSVQATAPSSPTGSPFTWAGAASGNVNCSSSAFPTASANVTVTAATAATTTTGSNATATYGDASVTLSSAVTPNTVNVGTVTFTVKSGSTIIGSVTSGTVSGGAASASFPLSSTAAGTYTIEAAYSGGTGFSASNNSAQSPAPTLTVNKKDLTITPNAGQNKVYGDADPTLTYTHSALGGTDTDSVFTGALGRAAGENVGTYTIDLGTLSAGSNYQLLLAATPVTFAVTPKSVTVTPDAGQNKMYGDADPTLTYTHSALGGSDTDSVFTGALGRAAGENVGTYPITLGSLSAGSNYQLLLSATPVTFAVTPKSVTVTPDAGQNKVYGDAEPTLTYTHGPLGGGDTDSVFTGALGRAAGENVGTYAIDLGTLSAGGNYQLLLATPVTFAITPKPVTVTPDAGQNKVYGDADPTLTYALGESIAVTGALGRAAGENVGTYSIDLGTLCSTSANYTLVLSPVSITFAITPKTVVITPASGQSKVYGDADPALTYTHSPLGGTDTDSVFSGALARAAGENVGSYLINLNTLSAGGNYFLVLSATPVNFAITPATLTIVVTAAPMTYSGSVYAGATCAAVGVNGEHPASTLSYEDVGHSALPGPPINAGSYFARCAAGGAGTNYFANASTAAFTIEKASQSIAFTSTPPNPFTLGTTYGVSATGGGSGNPVTFSSLTPAICAVGGSTVTALTVGQCQVAANQAGNNNYLPAPQTVQAFGTHYNFTGFFRPVDNLPVLNVAKAGSGIPVKFSLNGNHGLNILANGYPLSGAVACSATEVGDIVDETVNAGGSSLNYDALTDQYIYVWKTQKSWAGSCRILVVRLNDGTDKIAKFQFTK